MRTYKVNLADGNAFRVNADSFKQVGDYVSFYVDNSITALVSLPCGGIITETHDTEKSTAEPVYYGPHACMNCGVLITKAGSEWGGTAFTYPEGPIYPNTAWRVHSCDSDAAANRPEPAR